MSMQSPGVEESTATDEFDLRAERLNTTRKEAVCAHIGDGAVRDALIELTTEEPDPEAAVTELEAALDHLKTEFNL